MLMGRGQAESGMSFYQENLWFHALFARYFKFVTVLKYIKEWIYCNKKVGFFFCLVVEDNVSKLCGFKCMSVL